MADLSIQKPMISIFPSAIDASSAKDSAKPSLQGADGVVTQLDSGAKHAESAGRPELRAAGGKNAGESAKAGADVNKAIEGFQKLLAMLMAMILKMEKADSQQIKNSSNRETALAHSQSASTLKLGENALAGNVSKAIFGAGLTLAGTAMSLKGFNKQLDSTRTNLVGGRHNESHLRTGSAGAHPEVKNELGIASSLQAHDHEVATITGGKMHAHGSAIHQMNTVSGAVIDGGQSSVASTENASKEIAAGDAGVQGRQTDVDIKSRSRDEGTRADLLSTMKSIIQSQSDVMSHIAQNTRM
ncbi:hypothetical protein MyNCGM683_40970 [Achromobacter xylosoxidans]